MPGVGPVLSWLLLASLSELGSLNRWQLAALVGRVAKTEKKAGVNVIAVNQFGGFNARTDTKDGTHPNVRGEQKIARKYFSALRPILKKM